MVRQRLPRRHDLYGKPRHEACSSRRVSARHSSRDQCSNELPSPRCLFCQTLKTPRNRLYKSICARPGLPQSIAKRLKQLGDKITSELAQTQYRPFVDSAPVLEHAIAEKAGIGWTGKHSLTLNKEAGSWFFLGELFINLPLPTDSPVEEGCGTCTACMTICPTEAIVAPYTVDARRCISYLTIESDDDIPEALRPKMGNRIYGCDDCQLVCPWNRFADVTSEDDFHPRQVLHGQSLNTLFSWSEETFLSNTEGSPIRRIGYEKWQRNIAVALGNAPFDANSVMLLEERKGAVSELVDRHIDWALTQQYAKRDTLDKSEATRQQQRLIRAVEKGLPRDA